VEDRIGTIFLTCNEIAENTDFADCDKLRLNNSFLFESLGGSTRTNFRHYPPWSLRLCGWLSCKTQTLLRTTNADGKANRFDSFVDTKYRYQ